jgi:hypothetical protein
MPLVGFEPMIPALERAKTVRALHRSVTVIDILPKIVIEIIHIIDLWYYKLYLITKICVCCVITPRYSKTQIY